MHFLQLFWYEDPDDEYDPSQEDILKINTQFVRLFFLYVDDGVEVGRRLFFRFIYDWHKDTHQARLWFWLSGRRRAGTLRV